MAATRQPKQRNATLLLTAMFTPHTNVGIAQLERAMRKYIDRNGWDAMDTLAAAARTRYTAIRSAPVLMNAEGARSSVEGIAPRVGQVASVINPGSWDGIPIGAITYQWKAAGVDIGGATSINFTLTSSEIGKAITCVVTCTNNQGSATSTTPASLAVTA